MIKLTKMALLLLLALVEAKPAKAVVWQQFDKNIQLVSSPTPTPTPTIAPLKKLDPLKVVTTINSPTPTKGLIKLIDKFKTLPKVTLALNPSVNPSPTVSILTTTEPTQEVKVEVSQVATITVDKNEESVTTEAKTDWKMILIIILSIMVVVITLISQVKQISKPKEN